MGQYTAPSQVLLRVFLHVTSVLFMIVSGELTGPANPAGFEVADAHEGTDQTPGADLQAEEIL